MENEEKIFVVAHTWESFLDYCVKNNLSTKTVKRIANKDHAKDASGLIAFANGFWMTEEYEDIVSILGSKLEREEINAPGWWIAREGIA